MNTSTQDRQERPYRVLMAETIRRTEINSQHGVNRYSGWLAAIRAGIAPAGELTAIAQASQYLTSLQRRQRSAALRAAAIRAINTDVPHLLGQSVGKAFAKLQRLDPSGSIEAQVAVLSLMPVDAAALVIDGLFGRLGRRGIGADFFDLARTLIFWGSGSGANQSRVQIVLDFHEANVYA